MAAGRPVFSVDEARLWAAKFGVCPDGEELAFVKDLPSYDDVNYHFGTKSGDEYVLKVHNGTLESGRPRTLEAQNSVIAQLKSSGLPVPSVVSTSDGKRIVPLVADPVADTPEENRQAHVRMLTYLQGDLVAMEAQKSPSFFQGVGSLAGRVTRALAGFDAEGSHWDWDWNMKNVAKGSRASCSRRRAKRIG